MHSFSFGDKGSLDGMSIHRIIREGRLRLKMTEQQFAEALGVTRSAVQQWEKEGGTAPSRKKQPAVAHLLGLSVAQLMSGDANTAAGPDLRGEVPLLSDVQAGAFKMYVDNLQPGEEVAHEMVSTSVPVNRYTFALRVMGDSMEPEFREGMVLIVEPDMEPQPGDYVIARNGADETTFKQLIKDGGEWYLKPLNQRWPIKPLGKSKIVGVVRAVEKRFR
jgi:SOS-response transcriptional repressor LexA